MLGHECRALFVPLPCRLRDKNSTGSNKPADEALAFTRFVCVASVSPAEHDM